MNKTTILLIDDNASIRENTMELLELAGYKVIAVEDGIKGLEAIRQQRPDLILCDIMMPELDGYGVIQAIHNIPDMAGVPFIYISAKSTPKDLRNGMNLGADDYLTKPFNNAELLDVISSRLKKSEQFREKLGQGPKNKNKPNNQAISFEDNIAAFSEHKEKKKVMSKQMIYMEGDSVKYIYYLVKGKIKTYKINEDGKEFITEINKGGDIFGHVSFFEDQQKESAMATEESELILIPKDEFMEMLRSNNEIAMKFIKSTTSHLLEADNKMLQLAYNSNRKKLADALLFYSKKYKDTGKDNFPVVRGDISALAGMSKESVSRTLTEFTGEGLIEIDPVTGNIKICDGKKLEKLRN